MYSEDLYTASPSEYLIQLLKDKSQLNSFSTNFLHINRLLDEEINKVRMNVFNSGIVTEPLLLPKPEGHVVMLSEKINVPVKEFPDFNFVGRLLGPRGLTAKQLELDTGCKILIRGMGSMRDKQKEESMKGKAKWEHLNEDLHVLINVEDTLNRAQIRLKRAVNEIKILLTPIPENEDDLKKRQLTELAMLNGTYRGFDKGVVLAKSRGWNNIDMDFFLPSAPTQLLMPSVPSPSPMFFGPIFQSPFNPVPNSQPLTPLPSPNVSHQSLILSPPPTDMKVLYQVDMQQQPMTSYEFNAGPVIAPVR